MTDIYEVTVKLKRCGDDLLAIDHRFARLPERETVKALLDEASDWFASLYGEEADERGVWVVRLDRKEDAIDAVGVR